MPEIYQPAEDSVFLGGFVRKEVSRIHPKKILDMGAGSGIQAKACIDSGINEEDITLADINRDAIIFLRKKFPDSGIIFSDLFENIKGKFDLIIFNPPYLPDSQFDKGPDTSGGKKGGEVLNKFLKQAKNHLSPGGEILILTSSLTAGINWAGYSKKLLGKKKLFFEGLYAWRLNPQKQVS